MLGLWVEQTEGAKFWLLVMHELKSRGVSDVLVAVVDGLKGFPDAIEAVFPDATVQTCLVHLIRRSLAYASYKERRSSAEALKTLYRAPTAAAAEAALDAFEAGAWGEKHPAIARSWRCAWEQGVPFFAFSQPIRRAIYTTNAIESLNSTLRRAPREAHGKITKQSVNLDKVTATRVTFHPGAKWSWDLKAYAGTHSCALPHVAMVLQGTLRVVMDDGSKEDFSAGEIMLLPPGHDAWCVGKTACIFVEFSQGNNYYNQLVKEWHHQNA